MPRSAPRDKPTVAIIGFGEFARLLIRHLKPHCKIVVASRREITQRYGLTFRQVDLETALAQDIIIPSIPAQSLETFLSANKHLINPHALVIDVCSVKVKPVEVMSLHLPKTCQILATHPLFGPNSATDKLDGQKIMVFPVRLPKQKYARIKKFLEESLHLRVIEATPEEHDKIMAYAQGLSHYVGRIMQQMRIPESELATKAYEDLLDMKRIQGNDSWELFESIMFENPYAPDVQRRFKRAMRKLDDRLGNN